MGSELRRTGPCSADMGFSVCCAATSAGNVGIELPGHCAHNGVMAEPLDNNRSIGTRVDVWVCGADARFGIVGIVLRCGRGRSGDDHGAHSHRCAEHKRNDYHGHDPNGDRCRRLYPCGVRHEHFASELRSAGRGMDATDRADEHERRPDVRGLLPHRDWLGHRTNGGRYDRRAHYVPDAVLRRRERHNTAGRHGSCDADLRWFAVRPDGLDDGNEWCAADLGDSVELVNGNVDPACIDDVAGIQHKHCWTGGSPSR